MEQRNPSQLPIAIYRGFGLVLTPAFALSPKTLWQAERWVSLRSTHPAILPFAHSLPQRGNIRVVHAFPLRRKQ
jgi:hypothetical protein